MRSRATRSRSAPSAPGKEQAFRDAVATAADTIRDAFAKTDPGVSIDVAAGETSADPWSDAGTATLLDAVALVPTGPLAMSPDFDDLVETSDVARGGDHRGRPADAAQPLALVERLRASGGDRDARRCRPSRRRGARGQAQLRRLAPGPGLARSRRRQGRLRAPSSASRRSSPRSTPGWRQPSSVVRCRDSTCSRSALRSSFRIHPTSA